MNISWPEIEVGGLLPNLQDMVAFKFTTTEEIEGGEHRSYDEVVNIN